MKLIISKDSADATVEKLTQGIEQTGLRLVAHINGQANAAKIGKEVPADQILEVFRPDFAIRVWQACKPAGHDIPLRIHVYEDGDIVKVACRMPSEVFKSFASPELDEIGVELDTLFDQILSSVAGA